MSSRSCATSSRLRPSTSSRSLQSIPCKPPKSRALTS
ncbi:hypothetical protein BN1708_018477 [Verticillium longisporum]|uniref:Uncharacterized protein n=1 Tax=Verticillium longisporum TaxID=100787 RepID=A0A0G4M7H4_VERLO|nr:hypothetical protein BN1708_018477 [Verticillium longisporum]